MQTSSPAFGVIAESPCIGVIKCEPPAAGGGFEEGDALLIETADFLLLETGSDNLLLE